jgi:hypothetical protein
MWTYRTVTRYLEACRKSNPGGDGGKLEARSWEDRQDGGQAALEAAPHLGLFQESDCAVSCELTDHSSGRDWMIDVLLL